MIFDRVELDKVNRAAEVIDYASGKSPNVARVLQTLGAEVLEVGFAGGDRGRFLISDLERAGIACDFVLVSSQTRLCTTVIDRAAGTATELVEESTPIEASAWSELHRKLSDLLPLARLCVFSGSLPPQAPQDFYARWADRAAQLGIPMILDARGVPLRLALPHKGLIAKLNQEELASTLNRPLETDAAVRAAMQEILPPDGAVIVTMGARGSLATNGPEMWHVLPPKVKAISAVGSGDAFAAGLAIELSRDRSFSQALTTAAACGTANALTPLAGHVIPGDVARLAAKIQVRSIAV
jgi:tagatose 6-phosphate kinase